MLGIAVINKALQIQDSLAYKMENLIKVLRH